MDQDRERRRRDSGMPFSVWCELRLWSALSLKVVVGVVKVKDQLLCIDDMMRLMEKERSATIARDVQFALNLLEARQANVILPRPSEVLDDWDRAVPTYVKPTSEPTKATTSSDDEDFKSLRLYPVEWETDVHVCVPHYVCLLDSLTSPGWM